MTDFFHPWSSLTLNILTYTIFEGPASGSCETAAGLEKKIIRILL